MKQVITTTLLFLLSHFVLSASIFAQEEIVATTDKQTGGDCFTPPLERGKEDTQLSRGKPDEVLKRGNEDKPLKRGKDVCLLERGKEDVQLTRGKQDFRRDLKYNI